MHSSVKDLISRFTGSHVPVFFTIAFCTSCSLTTTDVAECTSSLECRTAFGFGSACSNEGYCTQAETTPRCTKTYPEDLFDEPEKYSNTIVIGNLMDRSLVTHQARENAAQLALQQANEQGGVDGWTFGSVYCTIEVNSDYDDYNRQEAAVASARYLIDSLAVPAIVGPAASGDTQQVFQALANDDVLIISPSATSPALSGLESPPFSDQAPGRLWRTAPPDSLQGQAIASDMTEPGVGRAAPVSNVAVIHEAGAYGEGLLAVFKLVFPGSVTELPYDNQAVLGEAIASAGASGVQEVVFISSQSDDVIAFLDAASLPNYDGKSIFLTDGAANSDVLSEANPVRFPQVRGSRPAPLDPVNDLVYATFLSSYYAVYGDDATQYSFVAHAYDAAWLVAFGAAWALLREDGVTGTNIAKGLRRISDPVAPTLELKPSSWAAALQSFANGQAVNIEGASGRLDYDPANEETSANIEIWRIQGGEISGVDLWTP